MSKSSKFCVEIKIFFIFFIFQVTRRQRCRRLFRVRNRHKKMGNCFENLCRWLSYWQWSGHMESFYNQRKYVKHLRHWNLRLPRNSTWLRLNEAKKNGNTWKTSNHQNKYSVILYTRVIEGAKNKLADYYIT